MFYLGRSISIDYAVSDRNNSNNSIKGPDLLIEWKTITSPLARIESMIDTNAGAETDLIWLYLYYVGNGSPLQTV